MAELAPKKQRNCAIDFWRVFCTLAISIMHFINRCWWIIPEEIQEINPFCWNGGYVLGFFLLTSGYFMIASYKSKQRRGLTNISAGKQASEYSLGRWRALFPALLVGMVAGYIQICYTNGYSLEEWYTSFNLNFWDFTGLHATNAMALPHDMGGNAQFDINSTIATQVTTFNYPLWYISAILVSSMAMYYLLAKNEELFKCVIAPFLSVAFLSSYAFSEINWGSFREGNVLGLPIDVMWVVGGMSIGALLWYFVEFLKKKKLGKGAKIGLTILNVVVSVQWIYMIYSNFWSTHMTTDPGAGANAVFNEQVYMPYQLIIIVCCMLNHDYLTDILNRPFLAKLGEYSLYYFVMHYPVCGVVSYLGIKVFNCTNYYLLLAIYLVTIIIAGVLCELLCKKVVEPLAAKFFSVPKTEEAVPAEAK